MLTVVCADDDAVAAACCATSSAGTNTSAVVRTDAFIAPPSGESSCGTARRGDNEPRRFAPKVVVDRDGAVGNAPGSAVHAKRVAVVSWRNAKIHVPHAVVCARGVDRFPVCEVA